MSSSHLYVSLSPCPCSLLFYGVCLYQSALFTFSFVENTAIHPETPAAPALPPTAPPKPKPKPKPKKSPVPPKGATAGAGHKGDEVPPNRKNVKAPSKQAPTLPPKPTSRNTTREAGEYALVHNGIEFRMSGSGMGSVASSRSVVFCCLGVQYQ